MEKILPSLLRLTKVAPLGCTLSFLSKAMPNKVNHEPFRFLQNFSLSFDEGLISFLELKKHHRKKMDERNSHAISSCTHRCTQHYVFCTVQCTGVRFARILSDGFITAIVAKKGDWQNAPLFSVHCKYL